jgi:methionine aminopeptidase
MKPTLLWTKTAAEIVHQVMKKLIDLCVEGGKVLDICMEGDKLIEQGTSAVYNKSVKGVKVTKGMCKSPFIYSRSFSVFERYRNCIPNMCIS